MIKNTWGLASAVKIQKPATFFCDKTYRKNPPKQYKNTSKRETYNQTNSTKCMENSPSKKKAEENSICNNVQISS